MKYTTGPILPASVAHAESTEETLSVLHFEDDAECVKLVDRQLNPDAKTFHMRAVGSLREGLSVLDGCAREELPDVILLDLNLPDSQLFETFERVKDNSRGIPIVVLSGVDDSGLAIRLVKEGAQDFLVKHFIAVPEVLARSLFSAVERARILRERDVLQAQLIQAEKLDSLGRIAAGVAHEVKNPLAIIQMGIAFLNSELAETDDANLRKVCRSLQDASNRAIGIIGGMVDFARDDSVRLRSADVGAVVNDSIDFLNYEINSTPFRVHREVEEELPSILVDDAKMQQVVMNLVRNSLQAMEGGDGTTVTVRVYARPAGDCHDIANLGTLTRNRDGGTVVTLEVRDEGPGIPEDKISRIFEPFFTTKQKGKGSGLGLSVVFHIIELHEGVISVNNVEEPRGLSTRIHLYAPS